MYRLIDCPVFHQMTCNVRANLNQCWVEPTSLHVGSLLCLRSMFSLPCLDGQHDGMQLLLPCIENRLDAPGKHLWRFSFKKPSLLSTSALSGNSCHVYTFPFIQFSIMLRQLVDFLPLTMQTLLLVAVYAFPSRDMTSECNAMPSS